MKRKTIILLFAALAACSVLLGVAILGYQDIQVISTPGNPASGYMRLFASGSQLGCLTSSGGNCLSGAGATIPSNCALITSNGTPALSCQTAKGLASVAYVAGGGTANAQTATYSPAIAAQADIVGYPICWLPTAANTGSATFNANSLGAQTIDKATGSGLGAIAANDLLTTAVACVIWDGTVYELQNPQTSGGGSSPLTTKGDLYTFSTVNTRLPVGSDGQCLTAQSGQTTGLLWASCSASGGGGLTQLAQTVVAGTSTQTVTFSGISGSYTNLLVEIGGLKSSVASVGDNLFMQVNGDTTAADYATVSFFYNNSSVTTNGASANFYICSVTGGSGTGSSVGQCSIRIDNYSNSSVFKTATSTYSATTGFTNPFGGQFSWEWGSTNAITSIKFLLSSGGSSFFLAGSTFTLYGVL